MFRAAKPEDAPTILDLLKRFHVKAPPQTGIAMDWPSSGRTIAWCISKGVTVVGPKSYGMAMIQPNPWNESARVAFVVSWYFDTPREIRVFEYLMQRCKVAGATHLTVASLAPGHAIDRYLTRLGLRNTENSFIRTL